MRYYARLVLLLLLSLPVFLPQDIYAQKRSKSHSTTTHYIYGKTYKTTGYTKVKRSTSSKKEFLHQHGYKKVPYGYEVDHIIPLSKGGTDTPDNMQLITKEQHKHKTAYERHSNSKLKYEPIKIKSKSTAYHKTYKKHKKK